MKLFLFTILVYCAVNCEDVGNNYYVVEMPNDEIPNIKKPFQVYWNVPTMQCRSKQIPFDDLYKKYGIIQNEGDKFRGEKITIMYEPGLFPAIFKNETSGKYRFRNGGVPQEGNLEDHLTVFKKDVQEIVPDANFNGIGIIDFESWRPIFRQNFGTLVPYKDVSIEIEKKLHWWWPRPWINTEAQRRFESSARTFMQTTLSIAKQMRPKASWGYYGFPHCFNLANVRNMKENCPSNVIAENDITRWMWLESTALYPSVYSSRDLSSSQLGLLVRGRVEEAYRLRQYDTPILPYFWFRYRDGGFMKEEDLTVVLQSLYKSNASGFIIWGSSNDVNTVNKCQKLHDYVETILGPAIAKYLQKVNRVDDVPVETPTENNLNYTINETLTTVEDIISTTDKNIINETIDNLNSTNFIKTTPFDPEFDWVPPENYSQDIALNVDEELFKKGFDTTDDKEIGYKLLNDSMITDILFDALFKSEFAQENNKQSTKNAQNETPVIDNATEAIKFESKDYMLITKDPDYENDILSKEIITNDIIINSTPKLNSDITLDLDNETTDLKSETDKINATEDELVFAENNQSTDIISKALYIGNTSSIDPIKGKNDALSTDLTSVKSMDGNKKVIKSTDSNRLINMILNSFLNANLNEADDSDILFTVNDKTITENALTPQVLEKLTTHNYMTDEELIDNRTEEDSKELQGVLSNVTNTDISFTTDKNNNLEDPSENVIFIKNNGSTSTDLDDFLIVSTNNTDIDFDTTTQYNVVSDLKSDRSEVENESLSDVRDSVSDINRFTNYSELDTNVDNLMINSEIIENLQSTGSDVSSDTTTESTDQVVTYVYYS